MNKSLRILLVLAAFAAVAYVAYRWYEARVSASGTGAASTGPTGQLGTNLNSIAPELVGGSEAGGTKVSPAVDVPINITMSSSSTMPALTGTPDSAMQPQGYTTASPLTAANAAAGSMSAQGSTASDVNGGDMTDVGVQNPETSGGANPVSVPESTVKVSKTTRKK